jgi:hypothetical protein
VSNSFKGSLPCSRLGISLISHLLCSVYIGTRPFVLRDATDPTQNLQVADSAEILEAVEMRLKEDILREAARLVRKGSPHPSNFQQFRRIGVDAQRARWVPNPNYMQACELLTVCAAEDTGGIMLPTWTAADLSSVKTSKEVWESIRAEGWPVEVWTLWITPNITNYQDPDNSIIEFRSHKRDPSKTTI